MAIQVRPRVGSDLERVVLVLAGVHKVDRYPLNWPEDPLKWLSPPGLLQAWVAEAECDAVVGHVALHRPAGATGAAPPATAEVARLFAASDARGQDIGSRLLGRARRWAIERRYGLVLEIVESQGSVPAIALYERTGWQHVGTSTATWTGPDGAPVRLRHYELSEQAY